MLENKIVCLDGATLYPVADPRWGKFADFGEVQVYDRTAPNEIIERAKDATILLTNKVVIDAQTIKRLTKLKCICVLATGYNVVDIEAARASGIPVCNIPAYSTVSVAQQAIALLLAMTNRVETYSTENRKDRWAKCADFTYRLFETQELDGKKFGVVGFGNTGRKTAAIAAAFGMKILVYTSKKQEDLPAGYDKVSLDNLFSESDVVSLHCPLTDSTRNLVNASRLKQMKPTALLINTSRGPVVDEHDLATALKEGWIAGAGLDVLSMEPPCSDNELTKLENCYITPHVAWATVEARERLFAMTLENIKSFVEGNPCNVVN
ncbi:MAG: D-2-hydroxyacid dehydrogenase [Bacteroidales bacterium]|nr:D-2-hydroxyacid dehydrogenase [Bacteroidales bacterium]